MAHKHIIKADAIRKMQGEERTHFLNPNAVRRNKSLGDVIGLKNIGVHIIEVQPGHVTTEYHKHYYEEECIYILSGKATATIEGEKTVVEQGDFLGFPIDGAAHDLLNDGHDLLVCLVMGQRLQQDVSDYPNQDKRLYRNSGNWEMINIADIEKVK